MASSNPALRPLTLPPDFARLAQQEREAQQQQNKEEGGQASAGDMVKAITGGMGDEDWSLNEKGEVINEEGLPMFDIHEELPAEPAAGSSSSSSGATGAPGASADGEGGDKPKPKMRYLVKKGGRTVVRSLPDRPSPLSSSTNPKSLVQPTPVPSASTSISSSKSPSTAASPSSDPSQPGRLTPQEVQSLLDELEAEEEVERQKAEAEAALQAEKEKKDDKPASSPAPSPAAAPTPAVAKSQPKPASNSAFAGFSSGFLAKSKQKRPSNSLVTPPSSSTSTSSSSSAAAVKQSSTTAASSSSPAPPAAAAATSPQKAPLKSALSRPSSPAPRSIFDKPPASKPKDEKKKVAWDMSEAEEWKGERAASRAGEREEERKGPIILGMGSGEEVEEVKSPGVKTGVVEKPSPPATVVKKPVEERPIKGQVVERPMKKPVPPGGGAGGAEGAKKRVSRFRRAKEELTEAVDAGKGTVEGKFEGKEKEQEYVGKGKGKAREEPLPPPVSSPRAASTASSDPFMPTPIHTISLSMKPTASSSSGSGSAAAAKDGTISYADIAFDSDEEDPDLSPTSSDDEDWVYSDSGDSDFDVDAALHQREVALAYHQQRMRVGAGRGTGALGGMHDVGMGEGVWEGVGLGRGNREEEGTVPADATLQSLTPDASLSSSTFGTYPGAGSAQLGRPSRFRQSNRHMESAQMIIPSLLAADPTLTTSHTPLGPALDEGGNDSDPAGFAPSERERLRRTLAALAAGEALPEDEQKEEAEKEVRLRGEWAREKAEREKREKERRERERREGGKAPPAVASVFKPQDPTAAKPEELGRQKTQEEELAELLMGASVDEGPSTSTPQEPAPVAAPPVEAGGGKKLSRFRQKQLGLID